MVSHFYSFIWLLSDINFLFTWFARISFVYKLGVSWGFLHIRQINHSETLVLSIVSLSRICHVYGVSYWTKIWIFNEIKLVNICLLGSQVPFLLKKASLTWTIYLYSTNFSLHIFWFYFLHSHYDRVIHIKQI